MTLNYPGFGARYDFDRVRDDISRQGWADAPAVIESGDAEDEARKVWLGANLHKAPSGSLYVEWSDDDRDSTWRTYLSLNLQVRGMLLEEVEGDIYAYQVRKKPKPVTE